MESKETSNDLFIYLFIYWAQIKMNICDRWFAKKSEINTLLKLLVSSNISVENC